MLVLQRSREDSLYPVIPLTLNKSSRVVGERGKEARQEHYWKMAVFWRLCVYFLLKLNGSELCLCADSEKFISLNFSNRFILGVIHILQIQGPPSVYDLLYYHVLASLHNLFTFTYS